MRFKTVALAAAALYALTSVGPASASAPKVATASHLKLPNSKLTPGLVFAGVSTAGVCRTRYPASVHPVSVGLAQQVFKRYHLSWAVHQQYELDHLVPVGAGGTNTISNLWPEPLAGKYGAYVKDSVESTLRTLICTGRVKMKAAQRAIAANWYTALTKLLPPVVASQSQPTPTPSPAPTSQTIPTPLPTTPTPTPTHSTVAPPPTFTGPTWGDGTHLVGTSGDAMPAGLYTSGGGAQCYWERQNSAGGIIANGLHQVVPVVAIAAGDHAFKTTDCSTWHAYVAPVAPATAFNDGTHVVGKDIVAGTYDAAGGSYCYWERDSDLGGTQGAIIDNDAGAQSPRVTIAATDAGFRASGCGAWIKEG